jgi:hypothetical protein
MLHFRLFVKFVRRLLIEHVCWMEQTGKTKGCIKRKAMYKE